MIMLMTWLLPSVLLLMGGFMFISNRKHLLSMLLSLQYIVLILYLLLFMFFNMMSYEMFFTMMFLTFSVCVLILVSMIRTHGNDYFQSFSYCNVKVYFCNFVYSSYLF